MCETKPPLGVPPRYIWEDRRKQDLARAIHEYIHEGREPRITWIDELRSLVANPAPIES